MKVSEICEAYYTTENQKWGRIETTMNKLYVNGKLYEIEIVSGKRISERMKEQIAKFKAIKKD